MIRYSNSCKLKPWKQFPTRKGPIGAPDDTSKSCRAMTTLRWRPDSSCKACSCPPNTDDAGTASTASSRQSLKFLHDRFTYTFQSMRGHSNLRISKCHTHWNPVNPDLQNFLFNFSRPAIKKANWRVHKKGQIIWSLKRERASKLLSCVCVVCPRQRKPEKCKCQWSEEYRHRKSSEWHLQIHTQSHDPQVIRTL